MRPVPRDDARVAALRRDRAVLTEHIDRNLLLAHLPGRAVVEVRRGIALDEDQPVERVALAGGDPRGADVAPDRC